MMSGRSEDTVLNSNKFVGKRIENTLSFNVAGMTPHSDFDSLTKPGLASAAASYAFKCKFRFLISFFCKSDSSFLILAF